MTEDQYKTRKTLLQKIQDQQDDSSWEEFVFYYQRYIYAVVRRMNISYHDSQDIVQKVLLKVWQKLPTFDYNENKGRFRSWLCTVTRNTVITYINKKVKTAEKLDSMKQQEVHSYVNQVSLPAIEEISKKEWEIHVANLAMEQIEKEFSPKAINAFKMTLKGMSPAVIAKEVDIKENTVYVYKNRVKERLILEINCLKEQLN